MLSVDMEVELPLEVDGDPLPSRESRNSLLYLPIRIEI